MASLAHLQLLGLCPTEPAASLATCISELFENAVDACSVSSGVTGDGSRIDVYVARLDEAGATWQVRITDEGRGFVEDELGRVSTLFATSKASRFDGSSGSSDLALEDLGAGASVGVFGVGLKAVILWANLTSPSEHVEIRTTTAAATDVSILRVRLRNDDCPGGIALALHPVIEHGRVTKGVGSSFAGTVVSATLGGGPDVTRLLHKYFEGITAFLNGAALRVTLRLDGAPTRALHVPAAPLELIYTSDATSTPVPPVLAGVRAHLTALAASTFEEQRAGRAGGSVGDADEQWVSGFGEGVSVLNASSTVHATMLLAAVAPPTDDGRGSGDDGGTATSARSSARGAKEGPSLSVLAFLNNKQVGEMGQPSARCASALGLRKVQWKRATLSLHPTRLQLGSECEGVRGLWVVLHARSTAACPLVRFGDLAKTFIVPSKELVRAMATAMDRALGLALEALAAQGAPISKRDQQVREERHLASTIAQSIAEVVCRSEDDVLRRECCEALRLGASDDEQQPPAEADVASALLKHLLHDWSQVLERTAAPPMAAASSSSGGGGRGTSERQPAATPARRGHRRARECTVDSEPHTVPRTRDRNVAGHSMPDVDDEWLWEPPEEF